MCVGEVKAMLPDVLLVFGLVSIKFHRASVTTIVAIVNRLNIYGISSLRAIDNNRWGLKMPSDNSANGKIMQFFDLCRLFVFCRILPLRGKVGIGTQGADADYAE